MKGEIIIIDWIEYGNSDNLSLNNYAESNSLKIKKEIFKFLEILKQKSVGFKYFGINLFDMSTINELNLYKTVAFNDIIKFFSLIDILKRNLYKKIVLRNVNSDTQKLIKKCFKNIPIEVYFENITKSNFLSKNRIPNFLKSIIFYIRFIRYNFFFLIYPYKKILIERDNIFLIGYFANFEKEDIIKKYKTSKSWGKLPSLLKELKFKPFILNIYIKSNLFPNSKRAYQYLKNENDQNFIFSFLDFKDIFQILSSHLLFFLKSKKTISNLQKEFNYNGYNLFPLFEFEIKKSLRGAVLAENLIWVKSFKNFFYKIDKKINLIYVQENQSWEIPLIKFFKISNKGKLIAWQNQFVRKWDLRYYYKFNSLFSPDYFLVNSDYSRTLFLDYGYPKKKIIKVEHLRIKDYKIPKRKKIIKNSILILGDYDLDDTYQLISNLYFELKNNFKIVGFKSHPSKTLSKKYLKKHDLLIEKENIDSLIPKYEFFIVTNSSGAAIDLVLKGIIPIIYIPSSKFNNSPLGNIKEIILNKKEDLTEKLTYLNNNKIRLENFIIKDENFTRIKKLLKTIK